MFQCTNLKYVGKLFKCHIFQAFLIYKYSTAMQAYPYKSIK